MDVHKSRKIEYYQGYVFAKISLCAKICVISRNDIGFLIDNYQIFEINFDLDTSDGCP